MINGVLVVGGFGTIGGRLSERLEQTTDMPVRLSSRTSRQAPSWAPHASTCIADVTTESGWREALNGIETVVHLVSLPDFAAKEKPELAQLVGVDGTRNVLEASIAAGAKRFIFLSTGHVYGTPYIGHITENTPTNPQQPYGLTHLEAEKLVAAAHDRGDIEGVRVRLSNGFGFPKRADNEIWQIIINDLCRQAITSGRLELRSTGVQRRNFISYADVCTALIHLIALPNVGDGLFNLGSTVTLTIADAARRVQARASKVLGKNLDLSIPSGPFEKSSELNFDSTKIRSTGLTLTDDLDTEIDSLLRYCAETFS